MPNAPRFEVAHLGSRQFPLSPDVRPQAPPYPVVQLRGRRRKQAGRRVRAPSADEPVQFARYVGQALSPSRCRDLPHAVLDEAADGSQHALGRQAAFHVDSDVIRVAPSSPRTWPHICRPRPVAGPALYGRPVYSRPASSPLPSQGYSCLPLPLCRQLVWDRTCPLTRTAPASMLLTHTFRVGSYPYEVGFEW